MLDVALASGVVTKPSNGWYQKVNEEKKYRASELGKDFWKDILSSVSFKEEVERLYKIGKKPTLQLDLEEE